MANSSLDSITAAKAKLAEELRKLEEQEAELRSEQVSAAYKQVKDLFAEYGSFLTARQTAEIAVAAGASMPGRGVRAVQAKAEVAPKYWLPYTQETWSGRGRPPRASTAWEGGIGCLQPM